MTSFPVSSPPPMRDDSAARKSHRSDADLGGEGLLLVPLSICLAMIIIAMTLL